MTIRRQGNHLMIRTNAQEVIQNSLEQSNLVVLIWLFDKGQNEAADNLADQTNGLG